MTTRENLLKNSNRMRRSRLFPFRTGTTRKTNKILKKIFAQGSVYRANRLYAFFKINHKKKKNHRKIDTFSTLRLQNPKTSRERRPLRGQLAVVYNRVRKYFDYF